MADNMDFNYFFRAFKTEFGKLVKEEMFFLKSDWNWPQNSATSIMEYIAVYNLVKKYCQRHREKLVIKTESFLKIAARKRRYDIQICRLSKGNTFDCLGTIELENCSDMSKLKLNFEKLLYAQSGWRALICYPKKKDRNKLKTELGKIKSKRHATKEIYIIYGQATDKERYHDDYFQILEI